MAGWSSKSVKFWWWIYCSWEYWSKCAVFYIVKTKQNKLKQNKTKQLRVLLSVMFYISIAERNYCNDCYNVLVPIGKKKGSCLKACIFKMLKTYSLQRKHTDHADSKNTRLFPVWCNAIMVMDPTYKNNNHKHIGPIYHYIILYRKRRKCEILHFCPIKYKGSMCIAD